MGWWWRDINHEDCCRRLERELGRISQHQSAERLLLYDLLADVRALRGMLAAKLVRIAIVPVGEPMSLDVGKTAVATVNGFDQFGQPFPIDFNANPPSWSVSDINVASLATDPTLGAEDITGTAAGHETLSVTVAGFTATLDFDVVAVAPVLSSVSISTTPPI